MKKIILFTLVALLIGSCSSLSCNTKDPQAYLPGWSDVRLEFQESYKLLALVSVDGDVYFFVDTSPGWHRIPEPIDNVLMCK